MNAQRLCYTLLATLGVLVVGGGIGYYLATATVQAKTRTLEQKLAEQSVTEERLAQLQDSRKQFQKLLPLLPLVEAALPPAKNQSQITLQLQQLAANSGMTLPSVSFLSSDNPTATSQTVKAGSLLALPITIQLVGTYDQLQSMLRSLEKLDRYTTVSSLSIARADPKAHTLSFGLTINVYVKP